MSDLVRIGKEGAMGVVVFLIIFFIGMQLASLSLESGVSSAYTSFYNALFPLALASILAFTFFKVKYFEQFRTVIPRKWAVIITLVWIIFITFTTFSGAQLVPVPRASVEGFQLSGGTELYLATIIPAFFEDMVYLVGLPMIIAVFLFMLIEFGFKFDVGLTGAFAIIIIATFIGSVGYNVFVIPGFASAHVPAYGNTSPALTSVFLFGWGQSMVYALTGYFAPVAHITHNAIIFWGATTGFNIGPLSITGGGI